MRIICFAALILHALGIGIASSNHLDLTSHADADADADADVNGNGNGNGNGNADDFRLPTTKMNHQHRSLDILDQDFYLNRVPIISPSSTDPDACACSPRVYELTFDFTLECQPVQIDHNTSTGILGATCAIGGSSNPGVTDLVPVEVTSVTYLGTGPDGRPTQHGQQIGNVRNGDAVTFTSVSLGVTGAPRKFKVEALALNAVGDELVLVWEIIFSNACDIFPGLKLNDSMGWTIFTKIASVCIMSDIRGRVAAVALQGGAEWQESDSYQAKAIKWLESDYFSARLSDARLQQRYALACIIYATFAVRTLYAGVEPRGWIDTTRWITATDECEWFGLTCDAKGFVEKIALVGNRITGTFPPETAIMAGTVKHIDLARNPVYNSGDEGHAWLGEMVNLRRLYFGETNFEYAGIPPQIGQLTNLVEFDCSYTLYFGPLSGATFASLESLEYLALGGNAYNSIIPVEIGRLPNLRMLYVQDAFVEGDLSFMEPMKSIIECWVPNNPSLGGTIPTTLGSVTSLKSFAISSCSFTGPIPSELGNLRDTLYMHLSDNMFTGTVPVELGNMSRLQYFKVEENLLTGVMPNEICSLELLQALEADCAGEIACDCCSACM